MPSKILTRNLGRLITASVLALTLPSLVACQSYRDGTERTAGQVTDDLAIQTAVKSRLLADEQVPGLSIQTEVYKNVVTLFGRVPDDATRQRALQIAREVKGVASVEDRLTIVPE
jgi:osmotically-inducible protein OsmY